MQPVPDMLGVVLVHLPGEIFKAIFSQFFVIPLECFQSHLVNFNQLSSILVSFKQAIQDKNARMSYRQEGRAKQRPRYAHMTGAAALLLGLNFLGVFQRPLTLILLQKYHDTNGRRIVI